MKTTPYDGQALLPWPGKSFKAAIALKAITLPKHISTKGRLVLQSFAIDVMVWFSIYFNKIVEQVTSRCGNVLLFLFQKKKAVEFSKQNENLNTILTKSMPYHNINNSYCQVTGLMHLVLI